MSNQDGQDVFAYLKKAVRSTVRGKGVKMGSETVAFNELWGWITFPTLPDIYRASCAGQIRDV